MSARRNALVMTGSSLALGLLFLYPTSTNRTDAHRKPGVPVAPAGVVVRPSAAAAEKVVNGKAVDTQYGLVQVQLHLRGTKVLAAKAIDYPTAGGRDREINSVAIPILERETVASNGLRIDTVSGATFTSEGYRASLQAALDASR